jgi:hypothetical protein
MTDLLLFQHAHLYNQRTLIDARRRRTVEIERKHFYFVGLRIKTVNGDLYHHAMMAADNEGALYAGIDSERDQVCRSLEILPTNEISVVFVRNLMVLDPDIVAAATQYNLNKKIDTGIARHDEGLYIVYGVIGDNSLIVHEVRSRNAMVAIGALQDIAHKQYKDSFEPLEVSQSHPVIAEFNVLFHNVVRQLKKSSDKQENHSVLLH